MDPQLCIHARDTSNFIEEICSEKQCVAWQGAVGRCVTSLRQPLFVGLPKSAQAVKLTVDKLGILDVITEFGRTGLQSPASVFYVSTYLYIPPGKQSADFDIVVAASATPGDDVSIATKCVGIPGNWRINNHCNAVNRHPQVLKVTITP
jgi:hypothetical protein